MPHPDGTKAVTSIQSSRQRARLTLIRHTAFAPALDRALAYTREQRLPALIELRCDPEVITPNATIAAIRSTARLR